MSGNLSEDISWRPSGKAVSATPPFVDRNLAPRPLVLRGFLVARDDTYAVMPVGMARVAPDPNAWDMSNQTSRASEAIWILTPEPEQSVSLLSSAEWLAAITRSGGEIPSPAVDNLFWLELYTERFETAADYTRDFTSQHSVSVQKTDIDKISPNHSFLSNLASLINDPSSVVGSRSINESEFVSGSYQVAVGPRSINESEFVSGLRQVETRLDRLFSSARGEQFEAGMESRFSENLQNLFVYYPNEVLQSLKGRLLAGAERPEVLTEMLQWASRQEAIAVRGSVIDLLCAGLRNPSSLIRDTAASSLAHLDERIAIPHLKQAIEREKVPELREDLEDLVYSLEA